MDAALERLADEIRRAETVVALTGAGISAPSGVPTFRGDDGVWEHFDEGQFTYGRFQRDPAGFWDDRVALHRDLFGEEYEPNVAHEHSRNWAATAISRRSARRIRTDSTSMQRLGSVGTATRVSRTRVPTRTRLAARRQCSNSTATPSASGVKSVAREPMLTRFTTAPRTASCLRPVTVAAFTNRCRPLWRATLGRRDTAGTGTRPRERRVPRDWLVARRHPRGFTAPHRRCNGCNRRDRNARGDPP